MQRAEHRTAEQREADAQYERERRQLEEELDRDPENAGKVNVAPICQVLSWIVVHNMSSGRDRVWRQ